MPLIVVRMGVLTWSSQFTVWSLISLVRSILVLILSGLLCCPFAEFNPEAL